MSNMKQPPLTDIELAVQEGTRRYKERIKQAYSEIGSVLRTAQLMHISEEEIQAVLDESK